MGAGVQVRDDGAGKVFAADPGRIYHIKPMRILGQNNLPAEAISTAPVVGEVYSAARINEWIAARKSQYKKAASWAMRLDHANADVAIEVELDAAGMADPK